MTTYRVIYKNFHLFDETHSIIIAMGLYALCLIRLGCSLKYLEIEMF